MFRYLRLCIHVANLTNHPGQCPWIGCCISVLVFDPVFIWEFVPGIANIVMTLFQFVQSTASKILHVGQDTYVLNLLPHSVLVGMRYGLLVVVENNLNWRIGSAIVNTFNIMTELYSLPEHTDDRTVMFFQHIVVQLFVNGVELVFQLQICRWIYPVHCEWDEEKLGAGIERKI
jgi:hypothetical protein